MLDLIKKKQEVKTSKILEDICEVIQYAFNNKQQNEKWFLDFLDELNKWSVIY